MSANINTTHERIAERGSHDLKIACEIIDESLTGHVGFTLDEQPYVIPMAIARDGQNLLLHGSSVSRAMKSLDDGLPCCVTVTHLDGLVLARSAFHSSMNYRSVMVFGVARPVNDLEEKKHGLDILVEHLAPGRLADIRASTRKELNATSLLKLPIETFSTKVRTGPPSDLASDIKAPVWAGVIPLTVTAGEPEVAPDMLSEIDLPDYLT